MNSIEKPVVLVIDPDPLTLTAIAAMLDSAQFRVFCARDREAAIKGASQLALDLIICDVNMPRMSGIELLEKMSSSGAENPPVLMLTTEAQPELIRQARQMGATGWLVKPFRPDLLIAAVRKMVA